MISDYSHYYSITNFDIYLYENSNKDRVLYTSTRLYEYTTLITPIWNFIILTMGKWDVPTAQKNGLTKEQHAIVLQLRWKIVRGKYKFEIFRKVESMSMEKSTIRNMGQPTWPKKPISM